MMRVLISVQRFLRAVLVATALPLGIHGLASTPLVVGGGGEEGLWMGQPPAQRLAELLQREMTGVRDSPNPILLPCCYDGLTARLVARAGFEATFMTGFGVSAVNGFPDTQLISYHEMQQACLRVTEGLLSVALEQRQLLEQQQQQAESTSSALSISTATGAVAVASATAIPCIGDGDTGYGNAINVKRTVQGYAQAGMAGIMIEDQVSPKRCGHVAGKSVVPLAEAVQRIAAAAEARDEYNAQFFGGGGGGGAPLILARTDALKTHGFAAALERCLAFWEAGADMTFLEAPETVEQMQEYCRVVPGPKLANMLEEGSTPVLPPSELKKMGYTMAAYPLTLLSASIKAMEQSLQRIAQGEATDDLRASFAHTKDAVGFTRYAWEENKYKLLD
ncbi:hypothetical protein ACA910_010316 [Epithemia clementina (nom. ined.)]